MLETAMSDNIQDNVLTENHKILERDKRERELKNYFLQYQRFFFFKSKYSFHTIANNY